MSENTKIEWTDASFNPWWGCQKVSPACDHCYAERDAKRFAPGRVLWGVNAERRVFGDKHWNDPLAWNRRPFFQCFGCGARGGDKAVGYQRVCKACGSADIKPARMRVFCASMGDWLDLDAPISEFVRLLDLVRTTPDLDWLLLSKRIGNWRKRLGQAWGEIMRPAIVPPERKVLAAWIERWLAGEAPTNVWIGATVVNQAEADRDITKLLQVPARVRFLSIEPMLGPITLSDFLPEMRRLRDAGRAHNGIHWVISGAESGLSARPSHPDWFRSLRDQCKASCVAYLHKQNGEWLPVSYGEIHPDSMRVPGNLCRVQTPRQPDHYVAVSSDGRLRYRLDRVGKQAAGRLLDGVEHNQFPETS